MPWLRRFLALPAQRHNKLCVYMSLSTAPLVAAYYGTSDSSTVQVGTLFALPRYDSLQIVQRCRHSSGAVSLPTSVSFASNIAVKLYQFCHWPRAPFQEQTMSSHAVWSYLHADTCNTACRHQQDTVLSTLVLVTHLVTRQISPVPHPQCPMPHHHAVSDGHGQRSCSLCHQAQRTDRCLSVGLLQCV